MIFLGDFESKSALRWVLFCFKPTKGADFAMKIDRGLDDVPLIGRPRFETGQAKAGDGYRQNR